MRKRALVVDGYPISIELVAAMLGDEWEVVGVRSAAAARRVIESGARVDAVVSDVRADGMRVCAAAVRRYPWARVVLMSGMLTPEEARFCARTGTALLPKPFRRAELLAAVRG